MEHEVYHKRMTFDASTLSSIEPILEGMPGGLFIYCAGGGEELLYINSAVLRIFGCDTKAHRIYIQGDGTPRRYR